MIKLDSETKAQLIECAKTRGLYVEGNIIKLFDTANDPSFEQYIKDAIEKDMAMRKKRLDVTKIVQKQNSELLKSQSDNIKITEDLRAANATNLKINADLQQALSDAEKAKTHAINDLDVLQRKTQYQLIESIVKVSLWVICGVGIITTALFGISLFTGVDNKIVESAWSNMFGILLTNSFSIIGTLMGVKYASDKGSNKRGRCKCEDED